MLCFQCNIQRTSHSGYDMAHCYFATMALGNRYISLPLTFFDKIRDKILNGVDFPELIECFNFKINLRNSRNKPLLYLQNISITSKSSLSDILMSNS